jgi:biopolymer transport protein ExbB
MRLERRLSFLGTLGNNAPFVGLLGTVIGIVQAFDKLQSATASGGGSEVMGAIAEALVATAIGLAVAIPAVAAFNAFQRQIKSTLGNCEALTHILLTHLAARSPAQTQVCPVVDPQASEPKSRRTTGTPSSQRFEQPALGV